ncbi:hypothetical protein GCM10010435_54230 [Winogradskya consettensis]|uniref:hypothetical protein n=1 Tax=Winogradskya consettensis TaxID=113560 RepID=UPI001BB3D4DD|nr:hypothetical protein [Actinoplanes consettensis]
MNFLKLIDGGQTDAVVEAVLAASPTLTREQFDRWWNSGEAPLAVLAAVGLLPTAAKTAQVLRRRDIALDAAAVGPVVTVARARGIPWLTDLAHRLGDSAERWDFVAGLLHAENAAPPTSEAFVQGWLWELDFPHIPRQRSVPLVDRLRTDPFLPALLPRIFEIDGLGTRLLFESRRSGIKHVLLDALAQLCADGTLDRATVLDGTLDRLVRGDRPGALRAFVVLHDHLAPTREEVTARAGDYLRLLTDAPGNVAAMAQKALLGADVEEFALLDASRVVLTRPEKTLVKKQLTWLGKLARSPEVAEVIAVAADHPAPEIRDRARALTGALPAPAVAVVTARGDDLPAPTRPADAPPPISDVDELREEVALLLRDLSAGPLERVLDGIVRLSATTSVPGAARSTSVPSAAQSTSVPGAARSTSVPSAAQSTSLAGAVQPTFLAGVLLPMLETGNFGRDGWDALCLCPAIGGVLWAAAAPSAGARATWLGKLGEILRAHEHPLQGRGSVPPLHRLLALRLAEISALLTYGGSRPLDRAGLTLPAGGGPVGYHGLLATPTSSTGAIDATALYERVAALGDRAPWRWDLFQAFLRIAPGIDEPLATRAAALGTPAGDALAARLRAGGLPQPVQEEVLVERRPNKTGRFWQDEAWERLPPWRLLTRTTAPPGTDPDSEVLLTGIVGTVETSYHRSWTSYWPALLPHHRGLIAAAALPQVASAADSDLRDGAAILPLLAECAGDGGVALPTAVAYGLAARHPQDRVAALDAFLTLAAAGTLDPAAVGSSLGRLAARDALKPSRFLEPLRDAAAAGAPLSVWRVLAAALPSMLQAPKPPRGTPDLLTLATETATTTGVRLDVDGLAAAAARPGGGRLVTEARRLAGANT